MKIEKKLTELSWYTPETLSAYLLSLNRTFLIYVLQFANGVPTVLCQFCHMHTIYEKNKPVNSTNVIKLSSFKQKVTLP